jgi:succinate dehydrogenase / fumarate reductase cytochrome b subunit
MLAAIFLTIFTWMQLMQSQRPININPLSIKLPVTAWVSILHRVSGVVIFLLIPLLLWALQHSLSSAKEWKQLSQQLSNPWLSVLLWMTVGAIVFHLIAGIRHLFMDMHFADSLKAGHRGAWLVLLLSGAALFGLGYWIWG